MAAQLLSGLGFKEVYNLKGGIKAWQGIKATGPKELNLDMITGDESPVEIIVTAYAMEQALQNFYREVKEKIDDTGLSELLVKLIDIEEKHKKTLYELFLKTESPEKDTKTFEEAVSSSKVMEGGLDSEEFMKQNTPFFDSLRNTVGLAMMLETQSLDLYLRFAEKSRGPGTKKVLFKIAEEEKGHLAVLGNLL